MTRGVLYIAFGELFVAEALASARSLKHHSPGLPVTLLADREVDSEYVDDSRLIEANHARCKVDYIYDSPYERTLYLDSDTSIEYDIEEMFGVLDRFDVALVHDFARKRRRWCERIPEYAEIPYAFPEFNGGLLLFGRSPAAEGFFRLWRELFHKYRDVTSGWDQATLRIALWRSEIRVHTLPIEYNVRSRANRARADKQVASGVDPHFMKPRVLHWRGVHRMRGLRRLLGKKYKPYRY